MNFAVGIKKNKEACEAQREFFCLFSQRISQQLTPFKTY